MPNILVLHEGEQPTSLGVFNKMKSFCGIKGGKVVKSHIKSLKDDVYCNADIVIAVRAEAPLFAEIMKRARRDNKFVIYFLDDDLKDVPKSLCRYYKRKKWLIECLGNSDLLVAVNPLINEEYAEFVPNGKTALWPSSVGKERIIDVKKPKDTINLVYAASSSHLPTFNKYILPLIDKLTGDYGEKLQIYLMGIEPKLALNSQIHIIPHMKLDEYNEYMRQAEYDIGIAPLEENHFSARKYFNKFIEYARFGIAGIYSDVMPYKLAVKDGVNGIMTENTLAAWDASIRKLIDYPDLRFCLAQNAQEYLRSEFDANTIYDKMCTDTPELISHSAPHTQKLNDIGYFFAKLRYKQFRFFEIIHNTFFVLFHYGIKAVFKKVKSHLK